VASATAPGEPEGRQQDQLGAGLDQPAPGPKLQRHRLARTRVSSVWVAVALFAIVLLLLLIFILQNGTSVSVSFFGASGHLPLGVALLLAAVLGVLLVVVPGTARIIQLRVTARRHRKIDMAVDSPSLAE
jgi:lipopolysaccharide assembly protein A